MVGRVFETGAVLRFAHNFSQDVTLLGYPALWDTFANSPPAFNPLRQTPGILQAMMLERSMQDDSQVFTATWEGEPIGGMPPQLQEYAFVACTQRSLQG